MTRLESSRVVIYGLLAGALVGLMGSGLRVVLDQLVSALAFVTRFRPPGTPGEGGLLMAFGEAAPLGLLALPVLATLAALLRPGMRHDPLEEAVRQYHDDRHLPDTAADGRSLVASTLAYLSGVAVGRDGPFTALGNLSARLLTRMARLSRTEARTLALSCVGAALGLVLHAPLAAAVLIVEVLYRRFEFEFEVLLPAVLASVAAYAVYGALHGFSPLLVTSVMQFPGLAQVPMYALLALVVSLAAWLVTQAREALPGLEQHHWWHTASVTVFASLAAVLAYFVPETVGDGAGWLQVALRGFQDIESLWQGLLRLLLLVGVAWLALGGTVLSAVSAGGLLGVGVSSLLPALGLDPAVGGLVGAAAFLTTSHNVPVAATLLLATWGGDALLPALLAGTLLAHALSGEASIVRPQVRSHAFSPVHAQAAVMPDTENANMPPEERPALDKAPVEEQLYRVPLPDGWQGLGADDVVWPVGVQYVALVRGGDVRVAEPMQIFQENDELVLLASPDQFEGFAATLSSLRAR
ncbi:chloride channel protein EriC [Deinococcus peraridilitoris DSM 19664]|uniref:Chloride channel protein EriC n=2 Tax=Deinococcus TaxID=1298 RepID=L0A6J8_DEIPD|nr:chloride channel protein EriC [Deinococcus peraridilitoris DSM 19664]